MSETKPVPVFYTVREAAGVLRVAPSTLYRAIREHAFPAVRIRSRYIVPAKVVDRLQAEAISCGECVDVAGMTA